METKNEFEQLFDVANEIGYTIAGIINGSETAPYCEDAIMIGDSICITITPRIGSGLIQRKYVKDFTLKLNGVNIFSWRSKDENDIKGLIGLETDKNEYLLNLVKSWPLIKKELPGKLELKEERSKILSVLKDFKL